MDYFMAVVTTSMKNVITLVRSFDLTEVTNEDSINNLVLTYLVNKVKLSFILSKNDCSLVLFYKK
jgi:hypothetical protein